MNKIALDLGFIKIYWYSLMILTGVILGISIINHELKKHNLSYKKCEDLIFYTILFGLIGARVYYVLFNLEWYLANPAEIIMVWHGGLAIHGGLLFGAIIAIIYCKKHNIYWLKFFDIIVPGVIIGQIIGRWGNFFNGEAHGGVVSLDFLQKLHLPKFIINGMNIDGTYYHPTFLYESFANFLVFLFLLFLHRKTNLKVGMLTSVYLISYGIIRFFVESLRTDSLMLGNIKFAQVASLILVVIGIILLIKSKNNNLYYEYNKVDKEK